MMTPTQNDDTGKPCNDCHEGTYVKYPHGFYCRYCGEPQTKQPARAKVK